MKAAFVGTMSSRVLRRIVCSRRARDGALISRFETAGSRGTQMQREVRKRARLVAITVADGADVRR